MKGSGACALALAILLGGCLGGDKGPSVTPAPAACGQPLDSALLGCVEPRALRLEFHGCRETAFTLDLASPVYELPPGFENNAGPAARQRLDLSLARCALASVGGHDEVDVSFATVGVLVRMADRGQGEGATIFELEVLTDGQGAAEVLASLGFPVRHATIAYEEPTSATQRFLATGDVDYSATVAFAPLAGAGFTDSATHHTADLWFRRTATCDTYSGAAAVAWQATQGELARASPTGDLAGLGAPSAECDIVVAFDVPAG